MGCLFRWAGIYTCIIGQCMSHTQVIQCPSPVPPWMIYFAEKVTRPNDLIFITAALVPPRSSSTPSGGHMVPAESKVNRNAGRTREHREWGHDRPGHTTRPRPPLGSLGVRRRVSPGVGPSKLETPSGHPTR